MVLTITEAIAYLGPEGTFCEQAARQFFSNLVTEFISCDSIADVFKAVKNKETKYGVVPLENSLQGSERTTLDLLLKSSLKVREKSIFVLCIISLPNLVPNHKISR